MVVIHIVLRYTSLIIGIEHFANLSYQFYKVTGRHIFTSFRGTQSGDGNKLK